MKTFLLLPAARIEPTTSWFGASLRIPVHHPRPLGHRINVWWELYGAKTANQRVHDPVDYVQRLETESDVLPVALHRHTRLVLSPRQVEVVIPIEHCVRRGRIGRSHWFVHFVAIVTWSWKLRWTLNMVASSTLNGALKIDWSTVVDLVILFSSDDNNWLYIPKYNSVLQATPHSGYGRPFVLHVMSEQPLSNENIHRPPSSDTQHKRLWHSPMLTSNSTGPSVSETMLAS